MSQASPELSKSVAADRMPHAARLVERLLLVLLAVTSLAFVAARFVDLKADFPIHVSGSGAMYTDEGLYARNALALEMTGDWYIPGEYNTAINYPVYTLLQVAAFTLFGSSLETLRGLTVVCGFGAVVAVFILMRRQFGLRAAVVAAAMILINYRHFVYSRFGNMDIPTTLFVCLGLAVLLMRPAPWKARHIILCGVLMFCGLLVKTSAIAGAAAAGFVLLTHETTWRRRFTSAAIYVATLVVCGGVYYLAVLLPNWTDFRAVSGDVIDNRLTSGLGQYFETVWKIVQRGRMDIDWYFLPIVAAVGPLLLLFRSFRSDAIYVAALTWLWLHFLMMGWIQYQPPRYFAPAVVPTFIVIAIMVERAVRAVIELRLSRPVWAGAAALALLALIALTAEQVRENIKQTLGYFRDRRYTLVDSANEMKRLIDADKLPRVFVLSHSAATALFHMKVESIGEHLGAMPVKEKIQTHKPTHFVLHAKDPGETNPSTVALDELGYKRELLGTFQMLRDELGNQRMYFYKLTSPAGSP